MEYFSAIRRSKLWIHARVWINPRTLCYVKEARHKRLCIIGSHLYETSDGCFCSIYFKLDIQGVDSLCFVPENTSDLRHNLISHDESRCLYSSVKGGEWDYMTKKEIEKVDNSSSGIWNKNNKHWLHDYNEMNLILCFHKHRKFSNHHKNQSKQEQNTQIYWIHTGLAKNSFRFSVTSYRKTWVNFLANPMLYTRPCSACIIVCIHSLHSQSALGGRCYISHYVCIYIYVCVWKLMLGEGNSFAPGQNHVRPWNPFNALLCNFPCRYIQFSEQKHNLTALGRLLFSEPKNWKSLCTLKNK